MTQKITILNGGTGRELARIGAPFRQPEWSALALYEAPERVVEVHQSFVNAGSDTVTTNSYAVVPFHIGEERFAKDGPRLAAIAGQLAREVAESVERPVRVLGCLPPALGSYRPEAFEAAPAFEIYRVLIAAQAPFADVWLGETLSSLAEAETVAQAVRAHEEEGGKARPLWLSFTLRDEPGALEAGESVLRSGESVKEAVAKAVSLGAENILFNCSHPEVMLSAIRQAKAKVQELGATVGLGVCANAFDHASDEGDANAALNDIRPDVTPERYLEWAQAWVNAGATLVGGCCGIRPDHIRHLAEALKD